MFVSGVCVSVVQLVSGTACELYISKSDMNVCLWVYDSCVCGKGKVCVFVCVLLCVGQWEPECVIVSKVISPPHDLTIFSAPSATI